MEEKKYIKVKYNKMITQEKNKKTLHKKSNVSQFQYEKRKKYITRPYLNL